MKTITSIVRPPLILLFSALLLVFSCSGSDSPGEAASYKVTVLSPLPSLTEGEITIRTGESLFFEVEVEGGEEPYTYKWFYVAQEASGSTYSYAISDEKDLGEIDFLEPGRFTFNLTVKDAAGVTRKAAVIVTVTS
ncbi:MAG TPA: hypothetical protein ENN34_06895 [Deltaproteobacteria bacterium]|nr:hypothetical protein [Deltaproteobacteria bacterium]